MGAMADAFGFTPEDFFRLTLPQLSAYSRYMGDKADRTSASGKKRSAPEHPGSGMGSVDSLEDLVMAFGTPESKSLVFGGVPLPDPGSLVIGNG